MFLEKVLHALDSNIPQQNTSSHKNHRHALKFNPYARSGLVNENTYPIIKTVLHQDVPKVKLKRQVSDELSPRSAKNCNSSMSRRNKENFTPNRSSYGQPVRKQGSGKFSFTKAHFGGNLLGPDDDLGRGVKVRRNERCHSSDGSLGYTQQREPESKMHSHSHSRSGSGSGSFEYKRYEKPEEGLGDRLSRYQAALQEDSNDSSVTVQPVDHLAHVMSSEYYKEKALAIRPDKLDELKKEFSRPEVQDLLKKYDPSYEFPMDRMDSGAGSVEKPPPMMQYFDEEDQREREKYRRRVEYHYRRLVEEEKMSPDSADCLSQALASEDMTPLPCPPTHQPQAYKPGIDKAIWREIDHQRSLSYEKERSLNSSLDRDTFQEMRRGSMGGSSEKGKVKKKVRVRRHDSLIKSQSEGDIQQAIARHKSEAHLFLDQTGDSSSPFPTYDSYFSSDIPRRQLQETEDGASSSAYEYRENRPFSGRSTPDPVSNRSLHKTPAINNPSSQNRPSPKHSGSIRPKTPSNTSSPTHTYRNSNQRAFDNMSFHSLPVKARNGEEQSSRTSHSSERSSRIDPQTYQSYTAGILHSSHRSEEFLNLQKHYQTLERIAEIEEQTISTNQIHGNPHVNVVYPVEVPRSSSLSRSHSMGRIHDDILLSKYKLENLEELEYLYADLYDAQERDEFFFDTGKLYEYQWDPRADRGLWQKDTSFSDIRNVYMNKRPSFNAGNKKYDNRYRTNKDFRRELSYRKLFDKYRNLDEEARRNQSFEEYCRSRYRRRGSDASSVYSTASSVPGSYIAIMENAARIAQQERPLYGSNIPETVNRYEVHVQDMKKKSKSCPDLKKALHVRSVSDGAKFSRESASVSPSRRPNKNAEPVWNSISVRTTRGNARSSESPSLAESETKQRPGILRGSPKHKAKEASQINTGAVGRVRDSPSQSFSQKFDDKETKGYGSKNPESDMVSSWKDTPGRGSSWEGSRVDKPRYDSSSDQQGRPVMRRERSLSPQPAGSERRWGNRSLSPPQRYGERSPSPYSKQEHNDDSRYQSRSRSRSPTQGNQSHYGSNTRRARSPSQTQRFDPIKGDPMRRDRTPSPVPRAGRSQCPPHKSDPYIGIGGGIRRERSLSPVSKHSPYPKKSNLKTSTPESKREQGEKEASERDIPRRVSSLKHSSRPASARGSWSSSRSPVGDLSSMPNPHYSSHSPVWSLSQARGSEKGEDREQVRSSSNQSPAGYLYHSSPSPVRSQSQGRISESDGRRDVEKSDSNPWRSRSFDSGPLSRSQESGLNKEGDEREIHRRRSPSRTDSDLPKSSLRTEAEQKHILPEILDDCFKYTKYNKDPAMPRSSSDSYQQIAPPRESIVMSCSPKTLDHKTLVKKEDSHLNKSGPISVITNQNSRNSSYSPSSKYLVSPHSTDSGRGTSFREQSRSDSLDSEAELLPPVRSKVFQYRDPSSRPRSKSVSPDRAQNSSSSSSILKAPKPNVESPISSSNRSLAKSSSGLYDSRGDSFRSSPTANDSSRPLPSRNDSLRSSPTRNDSFRSSPTRNDSFGSSTIKNDSSRSSPTRNDSFRSSPTKIDSLRSSPTRYDYNDIPAVASQSNPRGYPYENRLRYSKSMGSSLDKAGASKVESLRGSFEKGIPKVDSTRAGRRSDRDREELDRPHGATIPANIFNSVKGEIKRGVDYAQIDCVDNSVNFFEKVVDEEAKARSEVYHSGQRRPSTRLRPKSGKMHRSWMEPNDEGTNARRGSYDAASARIDSYDGMNARRGSTEGINAKKSNYDSMTIGRGSYDDMNARYNSYDPAGARRRSYDEAMPAVVSQENPGSVYVASIVSSSCEPSPKGDVPVLQVWSPYEDKRQRNLGPDRKYPKGSSPDNAAPSSRYEVSGDPYQKYPQTNFHSPSSDRRSMTPSPSRFEVADLRSLAVDNEFAQGKFASFKSPMNRRKAQKDVDEEEGSSEEEEVPRRISHKKSGSVSDMKEAFEKKFPNGFETPETKKVKKKSMSDADDDGDDDSYEKYPHLNEYRRELSLQEVPKKTFPPPPPESYPNLNEFRQEIRRPKNPPSYAEAQKRNLEHTSNYPALSEYRQEIHKDRSPSVSPHTRAASTSALDTSRRDSFMDDPNYGNLRRSKWAKVEYEDGLNEREGSYRKLQKWEDAPDLKGSSSNTTASSSNDTLIIKGSDPDISSFEPAKAYSSVKDMKNRKDSRKVLKTTSEPDLSQYNKRDSGYDRGDRAHSEEKDGVDDSSLPGIAALRARYESGYLSDSHDYAQAQMKPMARTVSGDLREIRRQYEEGLSFGKRDENKRPKTPTPSNQPSRSASSTDVPRRSVDSFSNMPVNSDENLSRTGRNVKDKNDPRWSDPSYWEYKRSDSPVEMHLQPTIDYLDTIGGEWEKSRYKQLSQQSLPSTVAYVAPQMHYDHPPETHRNSPKLPYTNPNPKQNPNTNPNTQINYHRHSPVSDIQKKTHNGQRLDRAKSTPDLALAHNYHTIAVPKAHRAPPRSNEQKYQTLMSARQQLHSNAAKQPQQTPPGGVSNHERPLLTDPQG